MDNDVPPGLSKILDGPVAKFLERGEGDPLDLIGRIEAVEEALEHWFEHAAPWFTVAESTIEVLRERGAVIAGQQAAISDLSRAVATVAEDLRRCHEDGDRSLAEHDARLTALERWSVTSADVAVLLTRADMVKLRARRLLG